MAGKYILAFILSVGASYCFGQTVAGRIDSAAIRREVVADDGISEALAEVSEAEYAYVVNGREMSENEADMRVRPWNVRSIRSHEEDGRIYDEI